MSSNNLQFLLKRSDLVGSLEREESLALERVNTHSSNKYGTRAFSYNTARDEERILPIFHPALPHCIGFSSH